MRIDQLLARLAAEIEERVDRVRHSPARIAARRTPVRIEPYLGFGTSERVWVHGRVVSHPRVPTSAATDSRWRNLLYMYRRLRSAEVPGARVHASLDGVAAELTADDEGFFRGWLEDLALRPAPDASSWHAVQLAVAAPRRRARRDTSIVGRVLVPPPSATFGVISDVDDTIIQTDATSLLRMGRAVLFGSARTRLPFSGVAELYRALRRGGSGHARNPLFYVSSSPWNLYDLLVEFFELERIPVGPLMLRDWGLTREELLPTRHAEHKQRAIERVLDTYPGLPFILIGDSGQEDPEIYRDVVHRYGERIVAIYIRNVTGLERAEAIHALTREVVAAGSSLVLADDTMAAARHAAEHGWIERSSLGRIAGASREDEAGEPGTPVEEGGRRREDTPSVLIAVERAGPPSQATASAAGIGSGASSAGERPRSV